MKAYSTFHKLHRLAPVCLPLIIVIVTGLRGLDLGHHWDEKGYQIAPVKTMLADRTPFPGYYGYPSFDYWISTAALMPEVIAVWGENPGRTEKLLETLASQSYLLRVRSTFLVLAALSVLWVYLLVLTWHGAWQEALLASCFLAFSWEVAYHIRWIATDGILMQFGALTVFFAMLACLRPNGVRWLYLAAVAAGLGMGTKYPGGLLLVPVLLAGYFQCEKRSIGHLSLRLFLLIGIFSVTFVISTPAIIFRPAEVEKAVLWEINHYSGGHAGHTVFGGLEHGWRMLVYFATVVFSHYPLIAITIFALVLLGAISLISREPTRALLFLSFPILYFLYFSMQRAMVVRNLLVLIPFLAVLASRGASTVWERAQPAAYVNPNTGRLIRGVLLATITIAMCVNVGWLFYAAETITERHSDRFAAEAVRHIEKESHIRFFLSPLVHVHLRHVSPSMPTNMTTDAAEAQRVLLYASEGLRWWQSWPANRPNLTERWFGPYEVNFNIYPNWWGDDRIIEIAKERADELGILVCCDTQSVTRPEPAAPPRVHARISASGPWVFNWAIPDIEPCALVSRDDAETVIGPLLQGPRPGGTAVDGTACTYIAKRPIVATLGLISTKSFLDLSSEPVNTSIPGSATEIFVAQINDFHDVRLLTRKGEVALMIKVAAWGMSDADRMEVAISLARAALTHLTEVAL